MGCVKMGGQNADERLGVYEKCGWHFAHNTGLPGWTAFRAIIFRTAGVCKAESRIQSGRVGKMPTTIFVISQMFIGILPTGLTTGR